MPSPPRFPRRRSATHLARTAIATVALLGAAVATAFAQTFVDVATSPLNTSSVGTGAAWGDYDNDGDLDLYMGTPSTPNKLFRNDGGGAWFDATSGPLGITTQTRGVAWADYDNDGDLDLYATIAGAPYGKLLRNDAGTFADVTVSPLDEGIQGSGMAWGDYDNDGDVDIFVAGRLSANKLFRNDGATWASIATAPLTDATNPTDGVAAGDYDNDGDLDLYLVIDSGQANRLFRNDGGTWSEPPIGPLADPGNGHSAGWGDYDNDGDLDVYVANQLNPIGNRLFRNDGSTWANVTSGALGYEGASFGMAWGDADNDGDLDIFFTTLSTQSHKLLRNDGGGTFVNAATGALADMSSGRGAAWGDYDNDGDLDLFVVNSATPKRLFRNDTDNGNHWLHVDLVGTVSNRSAIGARVKLSADGVDRIEEVSGGSGYFSQNSLTVEFGLGASTTIDSLAIRWPSGIRWDTTGVAVDQKITIVERNPLVGVAASQGRPRGLELAVSPNPSRRGTRIDYALPANGQVALSVHDLQGRQVARLADGEAPAGRHSAWWDGRLADGRSAGTGVYFVRLRLADLATRQRLVVLR